MRTAPHYTGKLICSDLFVRFRASRRSWQNEQELRRGPVTVTLLSRRQKGGLLHTLVRASPALEKTRDERGRAPWKGCWFEQKHRHAVLVVIKLFKWTKFYCSNWMVYENPTFHSCTFGLWGKQIRCRRCILTKSLIAPITFPSKQTCRALLSLL